MSLAASQSPKDPLVSIKSLSRSFGTGAGAHQVLSDVSLRVESGEMVAIVGMSGSGKTTLLNIIGGLDRSYCGDVFVTGQNLARLKEKDLSLLRNRAIGFVFQQFNLLEHLNCRENVMLPAIFARTADAEKPTERANLLLERVGLRDRAGDVAAELSGGQKQRLALARALFCEPEILLCDEPTGNLDARTGEDIISLFSRLNREEGLTLIIVTHEARVSESANRVLELHAGRIARSRQGWLIDG